MNDDEEDNVSDDEARKMAEGAAKALANLLGTSVAGFKPDDGENHPLAWRYPDEDGKVKAIDLNYHLFTQRNIDIAPVVILGGLVQDSVVTQDLILSKLRPDTVMEKMPEGFFFRALKEQLRSDRRIPEDYLSAKALERIRNLDERGKKSWRETLMFLIKIIYSLTPNERQVKQAISLLNSAAEMRDKRNSPQS